MQGECRLCNGSDRECVSPTAKATRKETLKVGAGEGQGVLGGCVGTWAARPRPHLPEGSDQAATSTPALALLRAERCGPGGRREGAGGRGPGAARRALTAGGAEQVQKENYRQEKKRATKQLLSALTDPRVVIMADSLKVGASPPAGRAHSCVYECVCVCVCESVCVRVCVCVCECVCVRVCVCV